MEASTLCEKPSFTFCLLVETGLNPIGISQEVLRVYFSPLPL